MLARIFVGLVPRVGRDLLSCELGALAVASQTIAFIVIRSMMPLKSLSAPIGSCSAQACAPSLSMMSATHMIEVRAGLVHLVDEDDARHAVLVALAPDRLGLRLDALVAVEHAYRAVEHAQRALDLDGEVDVAGRVDDVQALAVPEAGRRGRRDRDAALLLLLHQIHGRGAVVHFADLVLLPV